MAETPKTNAPATSDRPVAVTTGTTGGRVMPSGPGPTAEPKEVAAEHEPPKVTPVKDDEHAKVQKLPVSADGSVPALEGHKPEHRRVEDGEGSPRWRAEDGDVPPGFVASVPPERGLDP